MSQYFLKLPMVKFTHPSMTNWAHWFAMTVRASSSLRKNFVPRWIIISRHSSTVLSSNVVNVMKRENNSLAETTAVIGCDVDLITLTADWMVECSSWMVSTRRGIVTESELMVIRLVWRNFTYISIFPIPWAVFWWPQCQATNSYHSSKYSRNASLHL